MRNAAALLVVLFPLIASGQQDPDRAAALRSLAWQHGPSQGRIAEKAEIHVPSAHVFLDAQNTRRFLELAGNPPRDGHYLIAPESLAWFAVFAFDPIGYVKDDEKIDPHALLNSLKDSDKNGNEERKKLGMEAIYTDGWHIPPHYDVETKRLEWGARLRTERGERLINYSSRLLGRSGVMRAILVSDLESLDKDIVAFKAALRGFSFSDGERYTQFKPGDKVAEYGLAALVVGGAAAAAAKSGLLKGLGKFLWLIIVGGLAAAWGVIKGIFGRKDSQ